MTDVWSESSFCSRASTAGLMFWALLDWDLGMGNRQIGRWGLHFSVYGAGISCQRTVRDFIFGRRNLKAAAKIQERHDPWTRLRSGGPMDDLAVVACWLEHQM